MFKELPNNPTWFQRKVEIKKSPLHGAGVFATETIKKHEIFESCPVIVFHKIILDDFYMYNDRDRHILDDYVFKWENGCVAIALGCGSIYNHSNNNANATYGSVPREEGDEMGIAAVEPCIQFIAKRDINLGEEILIHYHRGKSKLDFDDAGSTFITNE